MNCSVCGQSKCVCYLEKENEWAVRMVDDMVETKLIVETLNQYQAFAGVTANKKLDLKTNIATLALGVAGEAGEVADHIKKHIGHDHVLDVDKVIKELGDVLWYVAVLSNALGISLQDVAQRNIDKLKARYPEGFSVEASKNRKNDDR